ncbi:unnamed protein product [Gongylonema pulchrum]|uniref:Reverse transcriptase domain-containing protein n=1 Tax=Gongylonema pulchrum TaxID=637853 RepID=A0A183DAJ3_9BILA|nr:unnamed protein product [Gongylonema pulchrum]
MRLSRRQRNNNQNAADEESVISAMKDEMLDEGSITENTLLAISPLRAPNDLPLSAIFTKPTANELKRKYAMDKDSLLDRVIDLGEVAIDSAPFQLVLGSSLYKAS